MLFRSVSLDAGLIRKTASGNAAFRERRQNKTGALKITSLDDSRLIDEIPPP